MSEIAVDRAAQWLVGDRLALVLHLGDGPLAYQLADQGHDVTVVGDDVVAARHGEIAYVRSQGDRLPFRSESFDVVVVPELRDAPVALAEFARVLTRSGLLATMTRSHDESLPWVRKLRGIIGERPTSLGSADTFTASGLFHEPETREFNAWEQLDLAGLLRFAERTKHPSVSTSELGRVHELWQEYGSLSGSLRLRHETVCLRARVDKSALGTEPDPPDTVLIDFR